MPKTYIISDTHFNGKVYSPENYTDLIFNNWQSIVNEDDIVIHAGDIASGRFSDVSQRIKDMPGYKILVKGNHDTSKDEKYLTAFDEVHRSYIKDDIIFTHFPVDTKIYNCKYNVFGHFHRYPNNMKDSLLVRYKTFFNFENNFTFCIANYNFSPVEINEFVKKSLLHEQVYS